MSQLSSAPLLDRLFDSVGQCLDEASARKLVALRADASMEERMEYLADKCNEGTLTPDERDEYETYVDAGTFIAILQAKARTLLASPLGQ